MIDKHLEKDVNSMLKEKVNVEVGKLNSRLESASSVA